MAPKSSIQTIVMVNLGQKYGQIMVKKGHFDQKLGQIHFFLIFSISVHDDDFRELSLTLLAQKKTQVTFNLSKSPI